MPFARILAFAALLSAALAANRASAAYTFTNIIELSTTSMNFDIDGDTVAVNMGSEIFTVRQGVRTTLVRSGVGSPQGSFNISPLTRIEFSDGAVSFAATRNGTAGVFRASSQGVTTIAQQSSTSLPSLSPSTPTSISGDLVAFKADSSGLGRIYLGNGSALTPLLSANVPSPLGSMWNLTDPVLSGDRVAFSAAHGSGQLAVLSANTQSITVIAKPGDPGPQSTLLGFYPGRQPAISGSTVAFNAIFGGPLLAPSGIGANTGILTGSGGPLTTIAKTGDPGPLGPLLSFGSGPDQQLAIAGQMVAFRGEYSGGFGLFVGDGGPLTTVLKEDDRLFGELVGGGFDRIVIDPKGSGRIAFTYRLRGGRRGIALATPVPEPAALTLAAAACALAVGRRRAN